MKIRFVIDGLVVHGMPASGVAVFTQALEQAIAAELRRHSRMPASGFRGRHVASESLVLRHALSADARLRGAELGARIAHHALHPARRAQVGATHA